MLRIILSFGVMAGLLVAVPMFSLIASDLPPSISHSMYVGYLIMLLALSLIFVGVKRLRDRERGGVIGFGAALLAGLGISVVASVIYAVGWDITLAATHFAFIDDYGEAMMKAARAKGASAAELQRVADQVAAFRVQYANPLYRLPMTFIEVFPVGVLVSLISAGLLRNPRFMPARTPISA